MASMLFGCSKNDDDTGPTGSDVPANSDVTNQDGDDNNQPSLTPEQVVDNFIDMMAAGDVEAASQYVNNNDVINQIPDEAIGLYAAYFDAMDYDLTITSDSETNPAIQLAGTTPDIDSAKDNIYSDNNLNMLRADYLYLNLSEGNDDAESVVVQHLSDILIDEMSNTDAVAIDVTLQLAKDSNGNYQITNPEELFFDFDVDLDLSYFDEEEIEPEQVQEILEILIEEGLVTEEQRDEIYAENFGSDEVYSEVCGYIESVAIPSLQGGQGPYGVDIRPAYIGSITYDVTVTSVSADEATAIVTGTVPDVDAALSGLNNYDNLVSVMTDAVSAAINSGSVGAGEATAISIASGMIVSSVSGSGPISFTSEVHLVSDGNGHYMVDSGADIIPNYLGAINNYSLDQGQVSAAASAALSNMLASGRITEDEYLRYSGQL